jgi:hypothetical protein
LALQQFLNPIPLHVNTREGYTIAVSEAKFIGRVAKRTVLSDSALSVLVPILEDILKWDSARIREVFESFGLSLQEWDKTRTDLLTFQQCSQPLPEKAIGGIEEDGTRKPI